MRRLKQWFWGRVWWAAEWSGIGLGRAAPWVLGQMLGSRGKRIDGDE